ncbi:MAG: ABC transporter ATP-binding protein [Chloroflexota bacterium]
MWIGGGWYDALDDEELGRIYNHHVVRRLLPYLRPRLGLLMVATAAMLVYTATMVFIPRLIGGAIDTYVIGKDLDGLGRATLFLAGILLINYVVNYTHMRLLAKISEEVLYKLRTDMFDHLQRLSVPFFDRNEVGRIMSRVQNDVDQLEEFLPMVILTLGDLLSLVGIVMMMASMNLKLAAVTLVIIPILLIIMAVWQRTAKPAFVRVRNAISAVNSRLQQNISGVRVVQSLNREEINLRQFAQVNEAHLNANLGAIRLSAFLMPTVDMVTALALGLVVVVGGTMALHGELMPGALIGFALYIQRFFDPIRNLTMQYTQFQRAMTAGVRIFQLLDVKPEVVNRPNAPDIPTIQGEVQYDHVSFHYLSGVPVIQDVSLHIRPGQTVALVGPTGAGKTTMVSLLARFYDVGSGCIAVDGHDVREVARDSLARQMSMVLQEPFLFSVSVADNIKYRHTEAPMEKVVAAARAVGAHDFIMRLDHGYDTVLQERGVNLSVGQRQLVSFARAVLADPRILILDEATANIDTFTEVLIQRALRELLKDRTAVVIAHRLSTIQNADMIVVMDKGRIIDAGTHDELLQRCALYARLYNLNFQDEDGAEPEAAATDALTRSLPSTSSG